jgi:hypothetical protein
VVGDVRECVVHDEAPGIRWMTRRVIRAHLGVVLAALVEAPYGGEKARDSRSSSPVASVAITNHVAQSRTGKEQSGMKMGTAAGRRTRGELLKPRDVSE